MEKQSSLTPYFDRIRFRYVMLRLNTGAELRISFYDAQIVNKNLFKQFLKAEVSSVAFFMKSGAR